MENIFEYIYWILSHWVMKRDRLKIIVKDNIFRIYLEWFGGAGPILRLYLYLPTHRNLSETNYADIVFVFCLWRYAQRRSKGVNTIYWAYCYFIKIMILSRVSLIVSSVHDRIELKKVRSVCHRLHWFW